jgi:hypothetical protein
LAYELPAADATKLEDHFAPAKLSPKAIDDLASQLVPEEFWKPVGIHTWLQRRAGRAFQKMPTSETESRGGRLGYKFEYTAEWRVLLTVAKV